MVGTREMVALLIYDHSERSRAPRDLFCHLCVSAKALAGFADRYTWLIFDQFDKGWHDDLELFLGEQTFGTKPAENETTRHLLIAFSPSDRLAMCCCKVLCRCDRPVAASGPSDVKKQADRAAAFGQPTLPSQRIEATSTPLFLLLGNPPLTGVTHLMAAG